MTTFDVVFAIAFGLLVALAASGSLVAAAAAGTLVWLELVELRTTRHTLNIHYREDRP